MSSPNTFIPVLVSLAGGMDAVGSQPPQINPSAAAGYGSLNPFTPPAQSSYATPVSPYCTYVYNVTDLSGNPLGTNMTPVKPRQARKTTPGSGVGIGYYDQNNTFHLWDANEYYADPITPNQRA